MGIKNAKATLEIYKKLEAGETISVEEVETCWGFIADVYGGLGKKVEKILSLFKNVDKTLFKNILWIEVQKYNEFVDVGYETTKGDKTKVSFKRKFLSMNDRELKEWHRKLKKESLASLVLSIGRTRREITACKQSIENADKRIEELKEKLKKGRKAK
jgi:hypothetical protein